MIFGIKKKRSITFILGETRRVNIKFTEIDK